MIGQLFIIGFKGDTIEKHHPIYRDIKDLGLEESFSLIAIWPLKPPIITLRAKSN
jgi:hypothetical protein